MMTPRQSLVVALVCAAACGTPTAAPPDGPTSTPPPTPRPSPAPTACDTGSACNTRLDGDGLCAGMCVAVESGTRCRGEAFAGLCFGAGAPTIPTHEVVGPWTLDVEAPPTAVPGELVAVRFRVQNSSASAVAATAVVTPGDAWTLVSSAAQAIALEAGASTTIEVSVRAEASTVFEVPLWTAATLTFEDGSAGRRGMKAAVPVVYAPTADTTRCGAHDFPATLVTGGVTYAEAACCDDVFFPTAVCCANTDCAAGGVCVDGACVESAPRHSYGSSPYFGTQRVLVVMLDDSVPGGGSTGSPCVDHAAEWREPLELDRIEAWFARTSEARVGRNLGSFQWTILGGLSSADLGLDGDLPSTYGAAVEQRLVELGCTPPWAEAFDRTIIASPRIEMGAPTGIVYASDRIGVRVWSPQVVAHEIAHTFGAGDLYLTSAGQLQYDGALMSYFTADLEHSADTLSWAEIGLGDVNQDGEVDALAFTRAPERLVLEGFEAEAFARTRHLVLRARVRGVEGGRTLRLVPRTVTLDLPAHGVHVEFDGLRDRVAGSLPDDHELYLAYLGAPRDLSVEAFEAIVAAGTVEVAAAATHVFTAPDGSRQWLDLSETRALNVSVRDDGLRAPDTLIAREGQGCGVPR